MFICFINSFIFYLSSSQQKPILEISKKGKIVTIKAKQQDVEVKSDGEMVSIKVD